MTDSGPSDAVDAKVSRMMPLWVGDYLADTQHLTCSEHGAYLLLIMAHWSSGPLPDDDEQLARIARVPMEVWCDAVLKRVQTDGKRGVAWVPVGREVASKWLPSGFQVASKWPKIRPGMWRVISQFFRLDQGRWHHDRVMSERARSLKYKQKMADRARTAASKRWGKADATSTKKPMLEECHTSLSLKKPNGFLEEKTLPTIVGCPSLPEEPAPTDLIGDPVRTESEAGKIALRCPVSAIVDLYHERLPGARRVMVMTPARTAAITARWRHYAIEKRWRDTSEGLTFFAEFFDFVARSAFLTGKVTGRDGRAFTADLAWLMKAENFAKTAEGKYHG